MRVATTGTVTQGDDGSDVANDLGTAAAGLLSIAAAAAKLPHEVGTEDNDGKDAGNDTVAAATGFFLITGTAAMLPLERTPSP